MRKGKDCLEVLKCSATFPRSQKLSNVLLGHLNVEPAHSHVIWVCLPSQSATEKHNQEKEAHKPLRTV